VPAARAPRFAPRALKRHGARQLSSWIIAWHRVGARNQSLHGRREEAECARCPQSEEVLSCRKQRRLVAGRPHRRRRVFAVASAGVGAAQWVEPEVPDALAGRLADGAGRVRVARATGGGRQWRRSARSRDLRAARGQRGGQGDGPLGRGRARAVDARGDGDVGSARFRARDARLERRRRARRARDGAVSRTAASCRSTPERAARRCK
jgi:hypothetical protein